MSCCILDSCLDVKGLAMDFCGFIADLAYLESTCFSQSSKIVHRATYHNQILYTYDMFGTLVTSLRIDCSFTEFMLCPSLCWTLEDKIKYAGTFGDFSKVYERKTNLNFNNFICSSKLSVRVVLQDH